MRTTLLEEPFISTTLVRVRSQTSVVDSVGKDHTESRSTYRGPVSET